MATGLVAQHSGSHKRLACLGMNAPLALFAYRRADPVLSVLTGLAQCPGFAETLVFVFSDGAKGDVDRADVADVRARLAAVAYPNVTIVERPRNFGLAASVIDGVGGLCARHGRAIVLEDDLVPAPPLLQWFNAALDRYEEDERVMQVAAFMFDVPAIRRAERGVFLGHPTSKGWAVWKRSWDHFDADCDDWPERSRDPDFMRRFEVKGAMRFARMMWRQRAGLSSSWAIRWHHSVVRRAGLVLYPPMSLVEDMGPAVGKATHGQATARLLPSAPLWPHATPPPLPDRVELDQWAIDAFARRLNVSPYGLVSRLSDAWRRIRGE